MQVVASNLEQIARARHRTKSDLARDMLRKRIAVERFRELFCMVASLATSDYGPEPVIHKVGGLNEFRLIV